MFDDTCTKCGSPADSRSLVGPYLCAVGHEFFQGPYCTKQSPSLRSLDWCCTETD
jgi:hypothetical protein